MRTRILDLSKADGYAVTDADLVIEKLKQDKCYKQGLVYRGFDGRKLETMLKHGTDYPKFDTIFYCTEEDLRNCGIESTENALIYASEKAIPALAVYDGTKFIEDNSNRLRFIDTKNKKAALVAVYLLR